MDNTEMTARAEYIIKKADTRARLFNLRLDTFDRMLDIAETHADIMEANQRLARQCLIVLGVLLVCCVTLLSI